MRVFITGIAGFLGSHLADSMISEGYEVIGIDNMIGGDRNNVPHYAEFHEVDCNDFVIVKRLMKDCEIVYHCAALAYEGLSVFSPHVVTENIVSASASIFSAAIANNVKRIVFTSSMARYGAIQAPFAEDSTPSPCDPYGIGKLAAERILQSLAIAHGIEYAIAVPHNIIGPRQKYDDPFRNVAAIMINLMLQKRAPIIYGSGSQMRCFSYITDCLYCLKMMAFDENISGEIINIGPDAKDGQLISIANLAKLIAEIIGYEGPFNYVDGRPMEVHQAFCSSVKARKLLDYSTQVDLRTALIRMVADIEDRGPKPFSYHLELEILNKKTPKTWSERLF